MNVLIKGMKIPETCIECMNSGLKTAIKCTEWTEISAGLRENRRAISCHLTEVSEPHGDLIDKDDICFSMMTGIDQYFAEEAIRESPTVIEAEDE